MMLALFALLACTPDDHAHPHPHTTADDHDHDHEEKGSPTAAPAPGDPVEAKMDAYTVRLFPAADSVTLFVLDDAGEPIAAEGEARVVLTGTGEDEQRVILKPDADNWSGSADAMGAPGYTAVVTLTLGGHDHSTKLTWGEVPEVAPAADKPHDHGDGTHDHGDGEHGHEH